MRHPSRPPDVAALLQALVGAEVSFVVVGSAATLLRGASTLPGDLDIVPDIAPENLARLAGVLSELEASVADVDHVGNWERSRTNEWRWRQREASPEDRQALLCWVPKPHDPRSFDHLLHTRWGNLDIVPAIAGTFAELEPRASLMECRGARVLVAHVADLLAALTTPRREKDVERVRYLRELQRKGENR